MGCVFISTIRILINRPNGPSIVITLRHMFDGKLCRAVSCGGGQEVGLLDFATKFLYTTDRQRKYEGF